MDEELPLPSNPAIDTASSDMQKLFEDIIKYRVDPGNEFYGVDLESIVQQLFQLNTNAVHAIDSELRHERKTTMFDPILQSFTQGCGGQITTWSKSEHSMIPAVFRGVSKRKEMDACRAAGRDFYYIDTGYFGNDKKKNYHRVTKNDLQNFGPVIDRPDDRLRLTGVRPAKCRANGRNILLAPPSQKLLNCYDLDVDTWLHTTIATIKKFSDRPIVIRYKQGRSTRLNDDTIEMALSKNVYCLVTFSSIAAGEALLFGKPAITLGPNAAAPLCSTSIDQIEHLKIPSLDETQAWCRHMAYCQFTESEMRDGTAWGILQDG